MALILNTTKTAPKLTLSTRKEDEFTVKLMWDGKVDMDIHALSAVNVGAGAKVSSFDDVLSPFNLLRRIGGETVGTIKPGADGTYEIHGGALVHSKDATDGLADGVDEWVRVRPSRFSRPDSGIVEIPILVMTHHDDATRRPHFREVQNLRLEIVDAAGRLVEQVNVSDAFAEFNSLHCGSLIVDDQGCHYSTQGSGFNGDINDVLAQFS